MAEPIDTDAMRAWVDAYYPNDNHLTLQYRTALAEVDRLWAENAALAAALADIAEIWTTERGYDMSGECASTGPICHHRHPDDPEEWCPVCVAEVAWCAWKMGVLGS